MAVGNGGDCLQTQQEAREFARRRLFFQRAMTAGDVICEDDLKPLRGSEGLPVVLWDRIIGLELAGDCQSDEPLLAHHLTEASLNWLLGSDAGIV